MVERSHALQQQPSDIHFQQRNTYLEYVAIMLHSSMPIEDPNLVRLHFIDEDQCLHRHYADFLF